MFILVQSFFQIKLSKKINVIDLDLCDTRYDYAQKCQSFKYVNINVLFIYYCVI